MKSISLALGLAGFGLVVGSSNAQAANLVMNGTFESTTNGSGQLAGNTNVTGWTVPAPPNSYSFLFTPGSADTTGVNGSQYGNLKLWGPNDGSTNGLPATSPDGGNYIAVDSAFQVETGSGATSISQTLNGLTPGQGYNVSFYDAAAQQSGFNGATFDQWQVSLGSQTLNSTAFNIPNHGFSGWTPESLRFTATNSSEVLNFLATGGPGGLPPFVLLDGVSVAPVPEPSFIAGVSAIMVLGLSAALQGKLAIKK